jgi:hypothetical protein
MIQMKKAKPLKRSLLSLPALRLIRYGALIFSGLFFFSCGQEPIFYEISLEVELIPPKISGTPANMVLFDNKMYVAGKRLFQYSLNSDGEGVWDDPLPPPQPSNGKISALAATEDYLYALMGELQGSVLYKKGKDPGQWENVTKHPDYPIMQTIYGDEKQLFVGAQKTTGDQYAILYEKDGELAPLRDNTGLLRGAVLDGSSHLLAVFGDGKREEAEALQYRGIFKVDGSAMVFDPAPVPGTGGINFAGIIHTRSAGASPIAAVTRNGVVYTGDSGGFGEKCKEGLTLTGGLALWEDPADSSKRLLLLGVQGGTGAGGYREILLSGDPWKIKNPGDQPSSVSNYGRYHSTIANHPVNYIFQAPPEVDPDRTIFASTQKDGFWSYRERDGEPQWNRES